MVSMKIVSGYCENYRQHINIMCEQNVQYFIQLKLVVQVLLHFCGSCDYKQFALGEIIYSKTNLPISINFILTHSHTLRNTSTFFI